MISLLIYLISLVVSAIAIRFLDDGDPEVAWVCIVPILNTVVLIIGVFLFIAIILYLLASFIITFKFKK